MVKIDFGKAERQFAAAMKLYAKVSKKEVADALNKKAQQVIKGYADAGITGVISRTPVADPMRIEQQLRANGLVYHKLIKKQGKKRKAIEKEAEKIIKARMKSAGYIRAGWYKAARAFRVRAGRTRKGWASAGYGVKATPNKTEALIVNKAIGAVKVAGHALALSMNEARKDMMKYIARKLGEKWGRKR